jgi:hypothetical protein
MSLLKKRKRKKPLRTHLPDIGCPFCWEWLPTPQIQLKSFSGSECMGGRCECGAFFVVDETGKSGGTALLDVQAVASDGDLERAMTLREGVDFELKTKGYHGESGSASGNARGHSHMDPILWAIRLLEKSPE